MLPEAKGDTDKMNRESNSWRSSQELCQLQLLAFTINPNLSLIWICISFQARSAVRDLDPTNDITFLRLRSKKNEILIAPGANTNPIVSSSKFLSVFKYVF